MIKYLRMPMGSKNYIVVERSQIASAEPSCLAKKICHPDWGLGAEGLIILNFTNHNFDSLKLLTSNGDSQSVEDPKNKPIVEKTIALIHNSIDSLANTLQEKVIAESSPDFYFPERNLKWEGFFLY